MRTTVTTKIVKTFNPVTDAKINRSNDLAKIIISNLADYDKKNRDSQFRF